MGLAPAWFVSAKLTEIEVRMFRSQPHGVGTERRGERNTKRSGELTTRRWTTGKVVRGVLASALLPFSSFALITAAAPAASAAAAACAPEALDRSGWTPTGQWASGDGINWWNTVDGAHDDTLTHAITNLPASGKQFTFDYHFTRGSEATTMTVSYGGVVYATATSPGSDTSQGVNWEASNGATVSPTSVSTSDTITITLPDSAPASGDLVFTANPVRVSSNPDDDHHVGNVKATTTNCADLSISKYGPAAVQPNGSVEYSIYVTNNGPSAGDYTVTDKLPADLTGATTSTPGCSIASGTLTCTGTGLGVDSTATITVQGTAPSTAGATLANTASVTGTLPDQDTSNNTSGTVNTNVDDTLGGPLADPLVAGGTLGTAGLAFVGIAVQRRRAARVKV
ncbi:DUF11 domain-containing protein [Streptomyces sioyaensis]|uniref:DUF11 domain-containing protein n=1 Tax=Streptomyces sioyaensis TaxID=67364 RepID=UPI00378B5131